MSAVPERGALVWVDFTPQSGSEQAGPRPALVISPQIYHQRSKLAVVCPITSNTRPWPWKVMLPEGARSIRRHTGRPDPLDRPRRPPVARGRPCATGDRRRGPGQTRGPVRAGAIRHQRRDGVLASPQRHSRRDFRSAASTRQVAPRDAVVLMDRAGWHVAHELEIPANLTPRILPAYSPELRAIERVWLYLRESVVATPPPALGTIACYRDRRPSTNGTILLARELDGEHERPVVEI